MGRSKVSNSLIYSLAIISIIGFIGIMANVWLGLDLIMKNATAYMLIVLGFGLAVEGQIRRWKSYPNNGFSSNEIAHVVTGIIGMLAIFVGVLDFIGMTGANLAATQAIVSAIAVIIIVLQTWVID